MDEIKTKSDERLISDLKELVVEERKVLTSVLHYLKEVEERRLYLERGYSSLFAFMTAELGYSEGATQRRIQAMRLLRDLPEVEDKIESGRISLSVASQVQSFLRTEDKRREISKPERLDLIQQLEGTSSRDCERKLVEISPDIKAPREKERPIPDKKTVLQFVADEGLMNGIDRLRDLLSHQNKEHRLDELFKKLVELGLDEWDPVRRVARRKARCAPPHPDPLPKGEREEKVVPPTLAVNAAHKKRSITASVRDEVWERDEGRCQYQDPETRKRCGSKHEVQLDHIVPVAKKGINEPSNLRLLCRQHNLLSARKIFGDRLIDFKMGR